MPPILTTVCVAKNRDDDEAFVRELASRQGVRFTALRAAGSVRDEASMRSERFQFLHDTANAMGARYIALGHSADDNVETVLHQLMRGTGPAGLAGIGSPRPIGQDLVLVRPLLNVSRRLIRSGLESIGQPWREDSSNSDTDYRRNWIRHQLIPLIESEYPNAVDAITRAVEGQRGWRAVIDRLAQRMACQAAAIERSADADSRSADRPSNRDRGRTDALGRARLAAPRDDARALASAGNNDPSRSRRAVFLARSGRRCCPRSNGPDQPSCGKLSRRWELNGNRVVAAGREPARLASRVS